VALIEVVPRRVWSVRCPGRGVSGSFGAVQKRSCRGALAGMVIGKVQPISRPEAPPRSIWSVRCPAGCVRQFRSGTV
jgi:hypothetical protein